VALMLNGEMVALASPRELRETGLAGTLYELDCDEPVRALDELPSVPGVREVTLYGTLLHVLVDATLPTTALRDALHQRGIEVSDLRAIRPSLEDVFVSRIRAEQARV